MTLRTYNSSEPAPRRASRFWERLAVFTNWPVLIAITVLSSLGVISIWADSPRDGRRQLIFLGVALVCLVLFQWINYQKIGRFAWGFYFFSLFLIAYTI